MSVLSSGAACPPGYQMSLWIKMAAWINRPASTAGEKAAGGETRGGERQMARADMPEGNSRH